MSVATDTDVFKTIEAQRPVFACYAFELVQFQNKIHDLLHCACPDHLSPVPSCHSRLLDELRFQLHSADAVDLAVDIVVSRDDADVPDLGADLDHR